MKKAETKTARMQSIARKRGTVVSVVPSYAATARAAPRPGQTFLTRIEQLIDEVCLDADGPIQKIGNEHLGERWFLMDHLAPSIRMPSCIGWCRGTFDASPISNAPLKVLLELQRAQA
jgi:hypothetical protein